MVKFQFYNCLTFIILVCLMSKRTSSAISLLEASGKRIAASSTIRSIPAVPGFNPTRCRILTSASTQIPQSAVGDCVIYWMSRDQRIFDNRAFHFAQGISKQKTLPLRVVFNVVPTFLQATIRQYGFMLEGLKEVEKQLVELDIPFHLLLGNPTENVPDFAVRHNAVAVVCDFSPLRVPISWANAVAEKIGCAEWVSSACSRFHSQQTRPFPLFQVDAHNVVPCWVASDKLEYAARTFRPKIQAKFREYLTEIPPPDRNVISSAGPISSPAVNWQQVRDSLEVDRSVPEVDWLVPGYSGAWEMLNRFITNGGLAAYETDRNDPNKHAVSNMSPYFHFGQIGVQRVVLHVRGLKAHQGCVDSFVEEAVVRRELSDNFCFYNPSAYDSLVSCSEWARASLQAHSSDIRKPLYTQAQLESANTYDDLWNAAQLQMVSEGKMHGFLRMYWAKKILEWTESPEEAYRIALHLNDKYSIDGRDPNGYVGVLWSIGGIHDMGWKERSVFGKIRYMNYKGCQRKFNIASFVSRYHPAAANAKRNEKEIEMKNN